MKRSLDTYREYLNTGREYEEKIVILEERVHQLEKTNEILNEFALNASNIIFKMDCLLVKKGEKISSLKEQIEKLSKIKESESSEPNDLEIVDISSSKPQIKVEFTRDDENLIPSTEHIESKSPEVQIEGQGDQNLEEVPEAVIEPNWDIKMEVIDEDLLYAEALNRSDPDLRVEMVDYDMMELNETMLPNSSSNGPTSFVEEGIPDVRRDFKMIFLGVSLARNLLF